MGPFVGQQTECQSVQCVTGKHGSRLAEGNMGGWFAAPQIVVIHTGQIVVDQRINVQRLDRRCGPDGTGFIHVEKPGSRHHKQGSQPFATTD